jgi:hypothetical protein
LIFSGRAAPTGAIARHNPRPEAMFEMVRPD